MRVRGFQNEINSGFKNKRFKFNFQPNRHIISLNKDQHNIRKEIFSSKHKGYKYYGYNKSFSENFNSKHEDFNSYKKTEEDNGQNNYDYPEVLKMLFENNILKKKLPCFEVYSSQIEILNSPFDYYLAIIVYFFYS